MAELTPALETAKVEIVHQWRYLTPIFLAARCLSATRIWRTDAAGAVKNGAAHAARTACAHGRTLLVRPVV